ncbi:MAG: MEDS domain-containing protein, partial [Chloroflexota bacterium]|nr:MEDS domain-containing protein [Chloroflexota bacterium]
MRVLSIVAWDAPKWPAPEDFLWIESRLDTACAALPVAIICAYDVTTMPGPALIYAGIESHKLVSIGGKLAANQLAVAPESYLTDRLLRLPWLLRDPWPIEAGSARGVHACAFFMDRDEEYATLLPLIHEGVERGDAAVHIIDPKRRADHLQRLSQGGLDVEGLQSSQQLEVRDWHETYLLQGHFDPERTLAVLDEVLTAHRGSVQPVADMSWAIGRSPGAGD